MKFLLTAFVALVLLQADAFAQYGSCPTCRPGAGAGIGIQIGPVRAGLGGGIYASPRRQTFQPQWQPWVDGWRIMHGHYGNTYCYRKDRGMYVLRRGYWVPVGPPRPANDPFIDDV